VVALQPHAKSAWNSAIQLALSKIHQWDKTSVLLPREGVRETGKTEFAQYLESILSEIFLDGATAGAIAAVLSASGPDCSVPCQIAVALADTVKTPQFLSGLIRTAIGKRRPWVYRFAPYRTSVLAGLPCGAGLWARPSLLDQQGQVVNPIVFTDPARVDNMSQIVSRVGHNKIGVRN